MAAEHRFTLASLAAAGEDRAQVETWAEGYVDRLDDGDTYEDLVDRLDGSAWIEPDGTWSEVTLPEQWDDPVMKRLLGILKKVRRETR